MNLRSTVYYGIAICVTGVWVAAYIIAFYRHEQPSALLHALMLSIVAHFFARAKIETPPPSSPEPPTEPEDHHV